MWPLWKLFLPSQRNCTGGRVGRLPRGSEGETATAGRIRCGELVTAIAFENNLHVSRQAWPDRSRRLYLKRHNLL